MTLLCMIPVAVIGLCSIGLLLRSIGRESVDGFMLGQLGALVSLVGLMTIMVADVYGWKDASLFFVFALAALLTL